MPSIELTIAGRAAVGTRALSEAARQAQPGSAAAPAADPAAAANARQLRALALSPLDKLRAAPVLAELDGKDAALAELDEVGSLSRADPALAPLEADARSLRVIYKRGPDALDAAARQRLIRRHGWFGQLAVSWGKPESDPARQAALGPARRAAVGVICGIAVAVIAGLGGLAMAILTIVLYTKGGLRSAYAPSAAPPPCRPAPPSGYAPFPTHPTYPPYLPSYGYGYPVQPNYGPPPLPPAHAPGYAIAGSSPHVPYFAPPPRPPASPPSAPRLTPPAAPDPLTPLSPSPLDDGAADPGPVRGGPFVEAFAVFLGGMVLFGQLLHLLVKEPGLGWQWVMALPVAVAIYWPRWRGVGRAEWRRALGWHKGRGALREIGAGFVGYVAGIPLFVVGLIVMAVLTRLARAHPTHPIQGEVGRGVWTTVQVYLLACVWAPIVEETMFRGALFHHLRRFGKGWSWLPSAALVALIFAAIHPQGWTFIPALGALAVAFAGLREWRGSILAPMTGALHPEFRGGDDAALDGGLTVAYNFGTTLSTGCGCGQANGKKHWSLSSGCCFSSSAFSPRNAASNASHCSMSSTSLATRLAASVRQPAGRGYGMAPASAPAAAPAAGPAISGGAVPAMTSSSNSRYGPEPSAAFNCLSCPSSCGINTWKRTHWCDFRSNPSRNISPAACPFCCTSFTLSGPIIRFSPPSSSERRTFTIRSR